MGQTAIESDGTDVFVVYNGVRIAKRGEPGTQAGTWVSLEPGYIVSDKDYPQELVVEYEGQGSQPLKTRGRGGVAHDRAVVVAHLTGWL